MDIEYNGNRDIFQVSPDAIFREFLYELRVQLSRADHVVCELVLDGEELSEAREQELGDEPAGTFNLLKVTAMPVAELVRHVIAGLDDAVELLQGKSETIGTLLQGGKRVKALEALERFIVDLEAFAEGIKHSFAFLATQGPNTYPTVDRELAALRDILERMRELLAAEEEVEFADLFRYEVPEHLASWRSFLDVTNQALAALHPAPPLGGGAG